MRRLTRQWKGLSPEFISIRATFVVPVRDYLCRKAFIRAVIRKLRDRISTLRVGNPLDKNTDIGAINSRPQLDKICELVQSGLKQGAELVQSSCPSAG